MHGRRGVRGFSHFLELTQEKSGSRVKISVECIEKRLDRRARFPYLIFNLGVCGALTLPICVRPTRLPAVGRRDSAMRSAPASPWGRSAVEHRQARPVVCHFKVFLLSGSLGSPSVPPFRQTKKPGQSRLIGFFALRSERARGLTVLSRRSSAMNRPSQRGLFKDRPLIQQVRLGKTFAADAASYRPPDSTSWLRTHSNKLRSCVRVYRESTGIV